VKLMYITSTLPYGGMEAFFIPEIHRLTSAGVDVVLLPMWPRGGVMHLDAADLVHHTVREPVVSRAILGGAARAMARRPAGAAFAVARAVSTWRPRIAGKNLAVSAKGLWAGHLARSLAVDHIHVQWAASTATLGWIASQVAGIPWSFTAHRWDIEEDNLIRRKAADAAFVRVISDKGAAQLRWLGVPAPKIAVIRMGVEVPEAPHPAAQPARRPLSLVTAANLLPKKGHVFLVRAIADLRARGVEVRADFAGGGPMREELQRTVSQLGLEGAIRLLGVVPHQELLDRLAQGEWDAMVLPSEVEGIPVSLMEAMARGIAVVGTEVGAIDELLSGGAGVIVPPRDTAALAAAIERLADPGVRAEMARAGRKRIEASFSASASFDGLLKALNGGDRP